MTKQQFRVMPEERNEVLAAMSREELESECDRLASMVADDMGRQELEEKIEQMTELMQEARDTVEASTAEEGVSAFRIEYRESLLSRLDEFLEGEV